MTTPQPSVPFRAFLLAGHPTDAENLGRAASISRADVALLMDLARDPSLDPDSACEGITLLSAWLSNRPHLKTPFALVFPNKTRESVEAVAFALLDRGADGLFGLERWLAGDIAPEPAQAAPSAVDVQGWLDTALPCPMALAFATGCPGLLRRLIASLPRATRGTTLDRLRCTDDSPLLHLASACSHEMTKVLLDGGADPNLRDMAGNTPLHTAASVQAVQALLSAGADSAARNGDGHVCRQTWMRTQQGNPRLKDMLAALPAVSSKRTARDAVFMGVWSAAPARLASALTGEGCSIPPADLAWMGALARMLKLVGDDRVGTEGVPARFRKAGFGCRPDQSGCLQACFMAATLRANVLPHGFSHVSRDERLSMELFEQAGGRLDKEPGEMNLAPSGARALRALLPSVADGLPHRLHALSQQLAGESQQPAPVVLRALFDAWGSALFSYGASPHLMELLDAAREVYPAQEPSAILRGWSGLSTAFVGRGDLAPVTPGDLCRLCLAWAGKPRNQGDVSRMGDLFKDMFDIMQAWGREEWLSVPAAIGCLEAMPDDSAMALFVPGKEAWAALAQKARFALAHGPVATAADAPVRRPRQRA